MIELNTGKIKEYGNDVLGMSQTFNSVVQELYARIVNVPTVTGEWQGESAIRFAEKAKKDKLEVLKLKNKLYKCGKTLVENAQNYEEDVKKLTDISMSKLYFDNYRIKNSIDHINSAYTSMYRAVYNPGVISIPYDFKYSKYIKNLLDDNETMMRDLLSDRRFLTNSLQKFENTSYENAANVLNIDK